MERVKLSEKLEFSRLIYGMWRLADDVDKSVSHVETKINKCLHSIDERKMIHQSIN